MVCCYDGCRIGTEVFCQQLGEYSINSIRLNVMRKKLCGLIRCCSHPHLDTLDVVPSRFHWKPLKTFCVTAIPYVTDSNAWAFFWLLLNRSIVHGSYGLWSRYGTLQNCRSYGHVVQASRNEFVDMDGVGRWRYLQLFIIPRWLKLRPPHFSEAFCT